ncbi:hypothetical protein IAQ67_29070 (plasmid) [Paenibacillus peoriae]|uniref:Uncharacterized protein n=1 Tax=Paenibacillus peoriae TaxID=59893 RepID=A0A7H0YH49_9BACL|nr:hypothetical protein [Paenibacillus peoriae]QNR70407.1 hypothetical protein IAQ67_29070 [Paenibacillus peoriae]
MSKKIRRSVKVKGHNRPIPFPTPESDKRKARRLRRKVGKEMVAGLAKIPAPTPLSGRIYEEVRAGRMDIGYRTWDVTSGKEPDWLKEMHDNNLQAIMNKGRRMELKEDNVAWIVPDPMVNAMPLRKLTDKPNDNG